MASRIVDVLSEFVHHIRLSAFAVLAGMVVIYYWPTEFVGGQVHWLLGDQHLNAGTFFHLFHFPHISLAAATCFLTVFRFSRSVWFATLISATLPTILCTVSDILLPYLGGMMLGVQMDLHLCIMCNLPVALMFLVMGILLGALLCAFDGRGGVCLFAISLVTHFLHELVSAVSSLAYMVGFGFFAWQTKLVAVTFLMLFAVVVPCLMSDFLVPLLAIKIFGSFGKGFSCCVKED